MRSDRVDFPACAGRHLLARFDLPDGAPRAHALLAHCFTCGENLDVASRLAVALAGEGIATLRLDLTGFSGGEPADPIFASIVADLLAAAGYMRELGRAPEILIGHGLGGAALLAAAHDISEARAVATIGASFGVGAVLPQPAERAEVETLGGVRVGLADRPFAIRRDLMEARGRNRASRIAALHRALLVMHAPLDGVVGIENARALYDAARHPKSFLSLDGADHLLSRREDAAYAAGVLAAWASRYVPAVQDEASPVMPVEETGTGCSQQDGRDHEGDRVRGRAHARPARPVADHRRTLPGEPGSAS